MTHLIARDRDWCLDYLSAAEREAIDHEASCYPRRDAATIEALKIVQQQRGWISDDSLAAIADYLGVGAAQVEAVATFYNLIFRRPVGKRVMLLCNSVSCWIMGCDQLRAQVREQLGIDFGETSADGEFTLLPITCLGDCDHAPALMIDREHHGDVDAAKLAQLLQGAGNGSGKGEGA